MKQDEIGREEKVKIKIMHQGGVIVNHACIYRQSEDNDIKLIAVDFKTKRFEITCSTDGPEGCGIQLGVVEGSLHFNKKLKDVDTWITFPGFKDYTIFSAWTSKYSLLLTLIKN